MFTSKEFILLLFFLCTLKCVVSQNLTCADLNKLYEDGKNLVNVQRLYDGLLQLNHITQENKEIGYNYFNYEFSQSMSHNVSEEYLKAKIYTQTASLFYDQLNNVESDVYELFQNYTHCFFEPKSTPEHLNYFVNKKYRSINGNGNNIKYPKRGESFTSFGRLLKHQYDDNIYSIRKSVRGNSLPASRSIVRKIFLNQKTNLNKFTKRNDTPNMLFLLFGQIIKHDTSSKQINQNVAPNEGVRCCSHMNKFQLPPSLMHSSCLPITISRNDSFYSSKNIRCLDFVRSNLISNNPYKVEVGEQMNRVTSFLDLSVIYGSDYERMCKIRSYNGGRLKMNPSNVLPLVNGTYYSGENRASQTKFFIVLQSLFVRNHNHIVDKLALLNSHWSEERLFQEARKINIAIYQNIIYNEYLPLLLGVESSKRLENVVYNPETDPSTLNEFSSAAFRFLHSFLPSEFELRDRNLKVRKVSISDALNENESISSYENILRGLMYQNISKTGYSDEILNKLFKNNRDIGLDLLSIDIMRSRDHGIAPYFKYRKYCDIKPFNLKSFNDLSPHISKKYISQLRETYKTVYDIDLIVGAALEELESNNSSESNSLVGPTLQCIMLEQFYRWKAGDYYFYTHDLSEFSFTKEQLKTLNQIKMSNFLCDNSDLDFVQESAFINNKNDVKCTELSYMDLSAWKEDLSIVNDN
ncbi:hypothetical protein PVAND_002918 [Polypedilum vanderplanki]|uniref:Peroxidase n=1 Tax=Polypedilum vanderplanki TaxID=319348 RepID=A0A9J6BSI4_POLVA|nr:hypothetical protein PVAND_002918 [Polypedilum vanderplanki]